MTFTKFRNFLKDMNIYIEEKEEKNGAAKEIIDFCAFE